MENRDPVKVVPDLRASGRDKFRSASLATFNKKIQDAIRGTPMIDELDTLPAPNFAPHEDNEDEDHDELEEDGQD